MPCKDAAAQPRTSAQGQVVLALLACLLASPIAIAQQAVGNAFSYSRTSAFTYRADGILETETIEPGDSTGANCVVTRYAYDSYGNKATSPAALPASTTSNCANASGLALFEARSSGTEYGGRSATGIVLSSGVASTVAVPPGLFATRATNALNQSESREADPRFGALTQLTGPNGLSTQWQLDDFGRKVLEVRADGTRTVIAYCLIAGRVPDNDISSNSATCGSLSLAPDEVPALAMRFEHSVNQSRDGQSISAFTRSYFDSAGRKIRVVTEAFDAVSMPGGAARLIVQDTDYTVFGAVQVSTQPYFLDSQSSTTLGAGDYGMTRFDYDALGRPTATYTADPKGKAGVQSFGARGSRPAAKSTMLYQGLATKAVNDLGQSRIEEKNLNGKLARVTDALGAQLVHQYDAFDNLIKTVDPLGNTITIVYDVRGRKLTLNDPDAGMTGYCYDALGQLKAQQTSSMRGSHTPAACPALSGTGSTATAVSGWTTLAYDKLGRLTSRAEREYITNWTYDSCATGIGKLCQVSTSHGITRRTAYDGLGRAVSTRTDVSGGITAAGAVSYDANGRVASQRYPTGLELGYGYTTKGFLSSVSTSTALTLTPLPAAAGQAPGPGAELPAGSILWQAQRFNAWGRSEGATLGNGLSDRAIFDPLTGRPTSLSTGQGTTATVKDLAYEWDSVGQLVKRTDALGAADGSNVQVADSLGYDAIGRLTQYTVSGGYLNNGTPTVVTRNVTLQYNALGMLLYNSEVGNYTYPNKGVTNGRPHAVQSVAGASGASYGYDLNGNVISATAGKYRSVGYTSFNLPDSQTGIQGPAGGPRYTWQYDENHQRIKEIRTNASGTRTTWFMHPDNQGGLGFEREESSSGNSNRHYLSAGGQVFGVLVSTSPLPSLAATDMAPPGQSNAVAVKLEYWHKDHLGSLVATTDHAGQVTARYAYDPFGKRRYTSAKYDDLGNLVVDFTTNTNIGTDRGFTGHEHLDDVGLIHMNGRVFDPLIGRFMQADPLVQDPANLQNYNRYAYCYNNSLACTDATGLSMRFRDYVRVVVAVVIAVVSYGYGSELAVEWLAGTETAATTGFSAATINATAAAGGGFAAGFSSSLVLSGGDLRSALRAGATGAVMGGATSGLSDASFGMRAAGKAGTAAAVARLQGGDWRRAARYSLMTEMGREAWAYTERETDRLYSAACQREDSCRSDELGLQTDGGRVVQRGISKEEYQNQVPGLLRWYINGGMAMEGSGDHMYDPKGWLCGISESLCSGVRLLVRQVSKPHDWGNSWSYEKNFDSNFLGFRVEGGHYDSLWARVGYETAVQTWSFVSMPLMAGFTGFALYGDFFNPGLQTTGARR